MDAVPRRTIWLLDGSPLDQEEATGISRSGTLPMLSEDHKLKVGSAR
jgi:hypothetical protein